MGQTSDILVKLNMDWIVTVVTSIPIPRYSDIKKKPLEFNCTIDLSRKEAKTYGSYQYRVHEYCAKVQPYIKYMQSQQKSLVHGLRQLLIHDLYAALPELHPEYEVQSDKPNAPPSSSPDDEKELNRQKKGYRCNISKCTTRLDHPGSRKPNLLDKR